MTTPDDPGYRGAAPGAGHVGYGYPAGPGYAAPPGYVAPPGGAPPRPPARLPVVVWILLGAIVLCFGGCFSYVVYAAAVGPDVAAKPGAQTPKRFIETMRARGLLGPGESPTYFYSDAMTDIEDGMYFFTDEKLVAYSSSWDPPAVVVPLSDVTHIDFARSTSWLDNSSITVEYGGGGWLQIPLSHDEDGDRHFYEALERAWRRAKPEGP